MTASLCLAFINYKMRVMTCSTLLLAESAERHVKAPLKSVKGPVEIKSTGCWRESGGGETWFFPQGQSDSQLYRVRCFQAGPVLPVLTVPGQPETRRELGVCALSRVLRDEKLAVQVGVREDRVGDTRCPGCVLPNQVRPFQI